MEFFLFLVIAAIISFVLLVIWIATRIAKLGGTATKVEQLERELDRVNDRLAFLEKRSSQTPASPVQSVQLQPAPVAERNELHIPLVRQVSLSMPPSSVLMRGAASDSIEPLITESPRRTVPTRQPSVAPPASIPSASSSRPMQARVESGPHIRAAQVEPVKRAISLEERLGQNWLNKLGIIALVTGLALLLGYQLRNLGAAGKSVTGFVISNAILVAGLVLERRNRYRMFARALIGGGWALLFFVTFALFHVPAMQVMHSQATDLVLMLAVASAMVMHLLRYRSQVVTSLAFLLGFFTVAISHVTVFSLIAGGILAAGLLVVAYRQRWFGLALGGLVAVYLNHGIWLHRLLPDGPRQDTLFRSFCPASLCCSSTG